MRVVPRLLTASIILMYPTMLLAQPVLPNVAAGAQYRVAFVTSGTLEALSSQVSYYNAYVDAAANTQPVLAGLNTNWTAIASTAATDAIDNTMTTGGGGLPIYLLDGVTTIAMNYPELWDGAIDSRLDVSEMGVKISTGTDHVWTGSASDGLGINGQELGTTNSTPRYGRLFKSDSAWIRNNREPHTMANRLYGISGTITAVPEPGAFWCVGLVGLSLLGWRKWKSIR